MNNFVHETSIVDENVSIGDGTNIWHWCHLSKNCIIGKNCTLGQNIFIAEGVTIGDNVKIQNNVSIFSGVILEDNVFLGPSMVFTNVINPRSFISKKSEYKATIVRKGASIGANATIICGNTIGKYSFVGAGSVVTKDVKDFSLMLGNPAIQKGWIDMEGEKLNLPLSGNQSYVKNKTNDTYTLHNDILSLNVNKK